VALRCIHRRVRRVRHTGGRSRSASRRTRLPRAAVGARPTRTALDAAAPDDDDAPPRDTGDAVPPPAEGVPADGGDDADEVAGTSGSPPEESEAAALRAGLSKTRGGFVARLGKLFARKTIDATLLDEIEEVLLTADIGPRTADKLFQAIKAKLSKAELSDPEAIWALVRAQSAAILAVSAPPVDLERSRPFVLLTIGVNGVGKTTTIGKLASLHAREGKKVLLAAGDTFRAAATEQLEIWADRAGASIVAGKPGADPSSVIFDGIKTAARDGHDVVIADPAGRLHTKVELMQELQKIRRVCAKAADGAPHETWLVVDATTGQNAIAQAQIFKEAMDITGIVLTKLDGTAKGGVILGICDELQVPVRYIGVGETIDDLRPFDARAFIDALYGPKRV